MDERDDDLEIHDLAAERSALTRGPAHRNLPGSCPRSALDYLALHLTGQVDLGVDRSGVLHVIHATGRAPCLHLPAGWLSLCIPLAGRVHFQSREGDWELRPGRMQVWRDTELRVEGRASGCWLGLAAPLTAWSRHVRALAGREGDVGIFPRESECPRVLRRMLVRLARFARGTAATGDSGMLLEAICIVVLEQQHDLHARLQRCRGRSLQRRQHTLLRLLRVRQLIETDRDNRKDLVRLARSVNYSPWHLIRIYREVFDETPSEHAARLRLERAWSMVHDTQLRICEIAETLGFESHSSFCRAFKNAYGATTGDVRQRVPLMRTGTDARRWNDCV
jgi:AraC-like DNA-binding protein